MTPRLEGDAALGAPIEPESDRLSQEPAMVYVAEALCWEYKVLQLVADDTQRCERELGALGKHGWELAAVASVAGSLHCFFKRTRA